MKSAGIGDRGRGIEDAELALVPPALRMNATAPGLQACPGCGEYHAEGGYCLYCRDAPVDLDADPRMPDVRLRAKVEDGLYMMASASVMAWFFWETRSFWIEWVWMIADAVRGGGQ